MIDYEYIRYGMKIFLELFCALSLNTEQKVMKPINHVALYYYYFASPGTPTLLNIMARKLNLLVKSGIPMIGELRDSEKNRGIVIKRIIFKMIKSRIKTFTIIYQSEITSPELIRDQKTQSIIAHFYLKVREDLSHFIALLNPFRSNYLLNLDEIRQIVF